MATRNQKKAIIVGAGVVGYALGKTLCRAGLAPIFVDVNQARVQELRREGFTAVADVSKALPEANVIFLCVPTPSRQKDGGFDGSVVKNAASKIFEFLEGLAPRKRQADFYTIIVKSTVLPEFMNELAASTPLKLGKDFGLAFNPEFLRSESAEADALHAQVVIGTEDARSEKIVEGIYRIIGKKLGVAFRFIHIDFVTASLMKYKHNLWLAAAMGHLMEFARLCEIYGADPERVIQSIPNPDPASWVRDDFLKNGFLDECLPKDSSAFSKSAREKGAPLTVLESAIKANQEIIRRSRSRRISYDPRRFKLLAMIRKRSEREEKILSKIRTAS